MDTKYSTDNIYKELTLCKKIYLEPKDLKKNLDEIIKINLVKEFENKCITEGYIKSDSIELLRRSLGSIQSSNFKGTIVYTVVFKAKICNPLNGSVIKARVEDINKLGLLGKNGPISVIIPREYSEDKLVFKDINIGNEVEVEVLGKKYDLNGSVISVVGRLNNNIKKKIIKIKKNEEIQEIYEEKENNVINIKKEKKNIKDKETKKKINKKNIKKPKEELEENEEELEENAEENEQEFTENAGLKYEQQDEIEEEEGEAETEEEEYNIETDDDQEGGNYSDMEDYLDEY
jgi:DNA-directed RNA polymerase subunit E'/Rpb7